MKKIILISGNARHGKDTIGLILKELLPNAIILHFADRIKNITRNYGWDGITRNDFYRTLWQRLGTERVREELGWKDFWAYTICDEIQIMRNDFDYYIIPDFRFENEFDVLNEVFNDKIITIRVERPNFDNELTENQKSHVSENGLNEFYFDYLIYNDGSLEDLKVKIKNIIQFLKDD